VDTDLLAVGAVTGTHGIEGAIKVKSLSGIVDHLLVLREAVFRRGQVEKTLAFEWVRPQPSGVIVKVRGFATPEEARGLVGYQMWVPRAQAALLGDAEYYEADICRCVVWLGGERVGAVRSVMDSGPSQLLEVVRGDGTSFLVPFTEHFIGEVDMAAKTIALKDVGIVR
jgi:16S rRNA processing protein RimM